MAKKIPRVHRTFTPPFKKDAIALVREGRSLTAVAHDLGIACSLLQHWRKQLGQQADDAFPGSGRQRPAEAEVRRFIAAHRREFRLHSLCRVLSGSRSGFYAWARRPRPRRADRNDALLVHIRAAYLRGRRAYGAPRVYQELRECGIPTGRHRIARLMRREGIVASTAPNQRWVSDITSIRTSQGWLHLAIVLDLYSRRIVGWAMHPTLTQALVYEALTMALTERRPAPGLLLHSDRGGQCLSAAVQRTLDAQGIVPSTSRPGHCLDNAVAESFFHTLKTELVYQHRYRTRDEARLAIFDSIAAFYNRTRRHSRLNYHSPEAYERQSAGR